ncbi:GNAT family N-acetyltransferase [Iodobacter sp. CM08]|uniref:GNAT family N-acetyltransferase n=1 Tax=Iodobacter sp. CM08 TaxID=3085902 RepID=UPI002980B031|nr:GNAT family N-acetyltransferase [Iodobacter sp. CM08]MDW5415518.1 GNAT family N-acetyltransferase [Iodobacter sp. CM08]
MQIMTTPRLNLNKISLEDAPFYLELINNPSWHQYIGDRGIRTLEQAKQFLLAGPIKMQEQYGYSSYIVRLNSTAEAIGICGFFKRDYLADADLGYALLPQFAGLGYAQEAASAALTYAKQTLGLTKLFAITDEDNQRSIKLLQSIGFKFVETYSKGKVSSVFTLDL